LRKLQFFNFDQNFLGESMKGGQRNPVFCVVSSRGLNAWLEPAQTTLRIIKGARFLLGAAAVILFFHSAGAAGPTGGKVVSGSGSIAQSGSTTTIDQNSPTLSLTWQAFNIAPQETVNFVQPSASAIAVNRIFGTSGSEILGRLNANGQVYLINPNGILFGEQAQVNVGGLIASTLNLPDSALGSDTRSFTGSGNGSIVNQGTITANSGGYVALLGNTVSNQGVLSAKLGTIALGAGSAATLTFSGNSLLHLQIDQSTLNNLAENKQLIVADGGQVIMTAGAKDSLLASVVNNTGIIEARTVENHNGVITLLAGMTAGTVNLSGTLDASAPNGGNGGFIETSGAKVEVANDTKVTTAAIAGKYGTWLIDPNDYTVAPTGGDTTGAALSTNLNSTNVTLQSSAGGTAGSGNVNINDTVSWTANTTLTMTASNNVNVNSTITATGATAGIAINPNMANGAETPSGTGTFNLGPGAQINLPNVAPTSTTALVISETPYTVINSLGSPGSVTGTDLQGLNGNLSGNYALGSNIDATATTTWNSGAGFSPIGTFAGTFNGLGHVISNLTIYLPGRSGVALFGNVASGGSTTNVGLTGVNVTAYSQVGALVGANYGSVDNSYATGSVSGPAAGGNSIAGLVGTNGGSVSNSYATVSVTGGSASTLVGGLVGYNLIHGTINQCYANGSVSGSTVVQQFGGLVGENDGNVSNSYAASAVVAGANSSFVGGLAGWNQGTINNSYSTGNVTGFATLGGLVGYNYSGGTVNNSFATGNVTALASGSEVGGLVGYNYGGTVSNSYATGNVSGTDGLSNGYTFGGLVGINDGITISNSYSTGNVHVTGGSGGTSENYIGGLVGINDAGSTISNSYSTGSGSFTSGTGGYTNFIGGLVGENAGTASHSYWNKVTSGATLAVGQGSAAGITGLTTAQMQTASNFVGFAFTTTPGASGNNWVIVDTDGTLNNAGGALGATFPMLASEYSTTIMGGHQLQLITMNLSGSYTLGSNINVSSAAIGTDVWTGSGFVPIGLGSAFTGTFNGLGHTITGLTINMPSSTNVGLFTVIGSGGTVENVGLVGGSVTGASSVGELAGINSIGGTISNSYATGSVTASSGGQYVGGLVGYNNIGTIINSYATASVTGSGSNTAVGGLLGENAGTVSNSYATGNVTGGTGSIYIGGLVGTNHGGNTVSNSYATGNVTGGPGSLDVGGLVGHNNGAINNSYASGSVTAGSSSNNIGGLTGFNDVGATVSNSYETGSVAAGTGSTAIGGLVGQNAGTVGNSFWDTQTSGQESSAGGTGLTTAQMQTQANFASAGWDVTNTWIVYDGYTYPLLRTFMTPLTVTANNATKTYNGVAYSGGNGVTYSAVPNGNLLGTVSFGGNSQGATNAGSYAIAPGGVYSTQQQGGYAITFVNGTLTVNPATLTVSGESAANKVYNGTTVATLSGGTLAGVISGDMVTLTQSGSFVSKNAGNGIAVTATDTLGGASAGNYTLTEPVGITANIAPKALTVTGETDTNKVYNGTTAATLSGGTLVGAISGDTVSLIQSGTFSSKNVGTSIAVTATDSLGGASAGNYTLTEPTVPKANITPLALTVSGETANNAVYNGTTAATLTGGTLVGVIGGDTVTLTQSGTFASKNAGTGIAVKVTDTITGASAGDYTLTEPTGITANITPKALTVSGESSTNMVYNGTTADTLTGGKLVGVISGDTVTLNQTGTFASKNVGTGIAVTATDTLGGASASDYTLTEPTVLAANITPKAITVTVTANNAVYDHSTTAVVNLASSGVIAGDVISFADTSSNFASANAGTWTVTVKGISDSGANASDYTLTNTTATTTAKITPLALSVSGETAGSKVYNGTTAATLTGGTLVGVLGGDTVTLTQSGTFASKNAGNGIVVTAKDTLGGASAGNYTVIDPTGLTANITPKALTVSGETAASKVYNGTTADALMGGKLVGVISGDTVNLIQSGTYASKNVGNGIAVTATDTLSGTSASDYTLTEPTGLSANITPKLITVTATGNNKIYDGTKTALVNLFSSGVIAGDLITFTDLSANFASANVGTWTVTVLGIGKSGADMADYQIVNTSATTTAKILP
jgi:trimeric autotransporter adhesin